MSELICIFGRGACGKSTLAARLASGYPVESVWCHDPHASPLFAKYKRCGIDDPAPQEPGLVILDEVQVLARPHGYRKGAEWVFRCLNDGRHYDQSVICVARRPASVHKDITAMCSRAYLGYTSSSDDVRFFAKEWGDSCVFVRSIPIYEFLQIFP